MDFDPYKEWLRIPPAKRNGDEPPDYYILLGLPRYESDSNRIHEAALQRMKLLRLRQAGSRAELTQRLMNEVSQARLCLTDAGRKSQYDFELEQRYPKSESSEGGPASRTPIWLSLAAGLLVVGGGAATYFAVLRSMGKPDSLDGVVRIEDLPEHPPAVTAKEPDPVVAIQPKPADKTPVSVATKKPQEPPPTPKAKEKEKAPESKPLLVKVRDLAPTAAKESAENEIVHLAALATDADEEDPTFLDAEGRLLGFQRKTGARWQFFAAERAGPDAPWTAEYSVQGFSEGTHFQGFAVEPDGLSCLFATVEGKGLLQAKRPNKSSAWDAATPVLAGDEPLKAAWPSLTRDGLELFCIQQRNAKPRVLVLKRASPGAAFGKPEELTALGTAFTQAAVSPDGKMLVLRGPEEIYVTRRNDDDSWSPPEVVLPLRAFAGANRALVVSPCFSSDGKWLLFASNRDGGAGGFDLWAAPISLLKTETPDLTKMTDKAPTKKPSTKKDPAPEKTKGKVAAKGPEKSAKDKTTKKAPVAAAAVNDTPVTEAVTEWLVLGPYPDATKQSVKKLDDLKGFEGLELLRRMPKENQKSDNELAWKRTSKFDAPGVYSVAVNLRLKASATLQIVVESAPGGGVLWLDGEHGELTLPGDLWVPWEGKRKGEAVPMIAGRHRLVGVICVADPTKPLAVRVVGDDGAVPEGLSAGY